MSWWRRVFGIDGFDVAVHAIITGVILFGIVAVNNNEEEVIVLGSMISVSSLVFLAIRRRIGLGKAERLTGQVDSERMLELEQRIAELELDHARIAELEERLDFTERLLAAGKEQPGELRR